MSDINVYRESLNSVAAFRAFYYSIGRPPFALRDVRSRDWWFSNDRQALLRAYLRWDELQVEIHYTEPTDKDRWMYGEHATGHFEAVNLPEDLAFPLNVSTVQGRLSSVMPPSQAAYFDIFAEAYLNLSDSDGTMLFEGEADLQDYLADWLLDDLENRNAPSRSANSAPAYSFEADWSPARISGPLGQLELTEPQRRRFVFETDFVGYPLADLQAALEAVLGGTQNEILLEFLGPVDSAGDGRLLAVRTVDRPGTSTCLIAWRALCELARTRGVPEGTCDVRVALPELAKLTQVPPPEISDAVFRLLDINITEYRTRGAWRDRVAGWPLVTSVSRWANMIEVSLGEDVLGALLAPGGQGTLRPKERVG